MTRDLRFRPAANSLQKSAYLCFLGFRTQLELSSQFKIALTTILNEFLPSLGVMELK